MSRMPLGRRQRPETDCGTQVVGEGSGDACTPVGGCEGITYSNVRNSYVLNESGCKALTEPQEDRSRVTQSHTRTSWEDVGGKGRCLPVYGVGFCLFFKSSPEDMFIDVWRGEGRERTIELLPPARTLTRNGTLDLSVDRTARQPTKPHWPGLCCIGIVCIFITSLFF